MSGNAVVTACKYFMTVTSPILRKASSTTEMSDVYVTRVPISDMKYRMTSLNTRRIIKKMQALIQVRDPLRAFVASTWKQAKIQDYS